MPRIADLLSNITMTLSAALAATKAQLAADIAAFNASWSPSVQATQARAIVASEVGLYVRLAAFFEQVKAEALPAHRAAASAAYEAAKSEVRSKTKFAPFATQPEADEFSAGFPEAAKDAFAEAHATVVAAKAASQSAGQFHVDGLIATAREMIERCSRKLAALPSQSVAVVSVE